MRATDKKVQTKCPYYYIKNSRLDTCRASKSQIGPDIVKKTYYCNTNEFKSCLNYIAHKFSTYKKAG